MPATDCRADDRSAAPRLHVRSGIFDRQPRPDQIDPKDVFPVGRALLEQAGKAAGNSGIGEEDVDAAMIGDGLLDQPLDVRLRARIDGDDVHALGAIRRDDRRAFRAE